MKFSLLLSCLLVAPLHAEQAMIDDSQRLNPWFQDAIQHVNAKPRFDAQHKAKNIILFVGDGMGVGTVTAARILDGQNKGLSGEENSLSFEKFHFTGLSKTYNVDAQTPDSAGTMTAIMTGVKTDAGLIGVDEHSDRGECSTVKGSELTTALELAELAGKSTGIVTTARVTHATPAATYAKSADRNWEDDSDMPKQAIKAGCRDIASQLITFESDLKSRYPNAKTINGLDLVMGGGRRHFLPKQASANSADARSKIEGDRKDGRNLINEWKQHYPTGHYLENTQQFNALKPSDSGPVLGLFNESHMHYEADRHNDISGEPALSDMTSKAIERLAQNDKGYFLMVEAGRIDHGHHAGNAFNALNDTIELAKAVQIAVDNTNPDDTLIIVTADHSHVFTLAGYPKRGNPILGKVVKIGENQAALAEDGLPYTTVGYMNGRGYQFQPKQTDADIRYDDDIDAGRHDLSDIDTQDSGYHQEALVPLSSETHSAEDVAIYATGPGAEMVMGINEQNVLFHIMDKAADLHLEAGKAIIETK